MAHEWWRAFRRSTSCCKRLSFDRSSLVRRVVLMVANMAVSAVSSVLLVLLLGLVLVLVVVLGL